MTYQEKLLDPRWQKKRLRILERDDFKCTSCENSKKTLHVHHEYYDRSKEPWEYDDMDLVTLCFECHNHRTVLDKKVNEYIYRKLASGLKNSFIRDCAVDVLNSYDINDLIYALWELRKNQRKVIQLLYLADQTPWEDKFSDILNEAYNG